MFEKEPVKGDDDELVRLVDELIDEETRKRRPKNCSTCDKALPLCKGCFCLDKPFGAQCGWYLFSNQWNLARAWRQVGAKGDCPAWVGSE